MDEVPGRDGVVRLRLAIRGAVQGVGFRPYIYRLATGLGLAGWVNNSPQGVVVEVEGPLERVHAFLLRAEPERPPRASIQGMEPSFLDPAGYRTFEIRESDTGGARSTLVLPDLATCPDCRREVMDPTDRRHGYPFTNCTNCGPRFSIIEALPYDRPNTSMRRFAMCEACRAEYEDPLDRRFHAQPNACPACGPQVALWDGRGRVLAERAEALRGAAEAIRSGRIVAIKGLGGFHLVVDARSEKAVRRLRARKHREEKPLALMVGTIDEVRRLCEVGALEERLLLSPECPIVLLARRPDAAVASAVTPSNPTLGVMLPYTPLHHLVMTDLAFPIVATSGNLSDEPICTDEREALLRLDGLADLFLVHDRPIVRHVDDSVVRVVLGREQVLRRARGYAPLPIAVPDGADTVLAVGAHLKSAVALAVGADAFTSQHIGDLETVEALDAFRRVSADLGRLYGVKADTVACDLHPDYVSTREARASGLPVAAVQHHYAHALACMADNALASPALAASWDGTGYGPDGTVWGGEFVRIDADRLTRVAHLRTFRLPGGDVAVREPRRSALGVLHELGQAPGPSSPTAAAFTEAELALLATMLARGVNAPATSSAGRLFDAAASLAGLRQVVRHEGQAAMELEFALAGQSVDDAYPFVVTDSEPAVVDWGPTIQALLEDVSAGVPVGVVSARFHNALAEMVVEVACRAGLEKVLLTGGCFQNRYLTERAADRLRAAGFRPYWHQRVPPNDGGIAVGQVMAVRMGVKG